METAYNKKQRRLLSLGFYKNLGYFTGLRKNACLLVHLAVYPLVGKISLDIKGFPIMHL